MIHSVLYFAVGFTLSQSQNFTLNFTVHFNVPFTNVKGTAKWTVKLRVKSSPWKRIKSAVKPEPQSEAPLREEESPQ